MRRRFGGHDEDRVLALLGLVQLQKSCIFRGLSFNLQEHTQGELLPQERRVGCRKQPPLLPVGQKRRSFDCGEG